MLRWVDPDSMPSWWYWLSAVILGCSVGLLL